MKTEKKIKEDILDKACHKSNKYGWKVDIVKEAIREAFLKGKRVLKD